MAADRRLQERGIRAINTTALRILTEDMDTMDFSSPVRPSYISGDPRKPYPAPIAAANLTEHNGDLYWGQNGSLYKVQERTPVFAVLGF